jgi:N-acetylneuraminate synthase
MKIGAIGGVALRRDRPFLIAEAGVNHEGSLARAFEMVDAAAGAGADMIKFQSYKAETLASRESPAYWDRRHEPAESQFALFQRYDGFDVEQYRKLYERCEARGILFGATCFDLRFVDALDALLPCHKIASADITNVPLLRRVAGKGKPVLLSTGASHLGEVEAALRWLDDGGAPAVGVLHCVLQYPTDPGNAHLRAIRHLAAAFPDATVGWSDHVPPLDGCLSLLLAWLEGAIVLEKHFTLDKSLPGNDHYHAMDPDDVAAFRRRCALAEALLGRPAKTVQPCEAAARAHARRSLVAARAIPKGTPITPAMLVAKRPGHGISPEHLDLLVGRPAPADLAPDEVLTWDAFLPSRGPGAGSG